MSSSNDSTDSFRRIDIDRLRIEVDLAPDLRVRFVGRDLALRKIIECAERGVGAPIVVYGLRAVEKLHGLDNTWRF